MIEAVLMPWQEEVAAHKRDGHPDRLHNDWKAGVMLRLNAEGPVIYSLECENRCDGDDDAVRYVLRLTGPNRDALLSQAWLAERSL